MNSKFRFSIIIQAGKEKDALAGTLDSVIQQDIGFAKHVQIILIADADAGIARESCLSVRDQFPENVVLITPTDGNTAATRKEGIRHAQGTYVNFLKPGSRWSPESFRRVYDFFEKRQEETDVVFCPGKEKSSRLIELAEQYTCIQTEISTAFIKAEALYAHEFDEPMHRACESKFVCSVLLDKLRYGVVAGAVLETDGSMGQQTEEAFTKGKEWYLETPKRFYLELIRESEQKYGTVLPFVQYQIASEIVERLREDLSHVLTEEEQAAYEKDLREVLSYLEDDIICQSEHMSAEYRIFALSLKYGEAFREKLEYRKGSLYFQNIRIYSFDAKSLFSVDVLDACDGTLQLTGRIWCPFADELLIYFENDRGEQFPLAPKPAFFRNTVIFGREMARVRVYEIVLPLEGVRSYTAYGVFRNQYVQPLNIRLGKYSHLGGEISESYYEGSGYRITFDRGASGFRICQEHVFAHMGKEFKLLLRCVRDKKYEIALCRIFGRFLRPFVKKERWLVMERVHVAGDNAEHFFRFLKREKISDIRSYFVISEKSSDYRRMKQIGRVLPFRGFRYKLNVLLAKYIVSSQAEDNIYNPWDKDSVYIRDLYRHRLVFLQHGIIKDDLSGWLNQCNKNLGMFVTSARPEYQSILDGDYGYDESVVKLTGLPRYDNLKQGVTPEKSILFLPTWRASLAGPVDADTGERAYNPLFCQSEFFQFYQRLIQDERLLAVMKKHGYRGRFFLHTHHNVQMQDFTDNDTIRLVRGTVDYQEEFQKNALLVTDFSSVAFDFAYLRKPVIYTQFDIDTFFQGQVYTQGYFDYERDGLGPVCFDYETTLATIIRYVEQDCRLEAEYERRGSRFYQWFDDGNCRRVYEEIRALDGKKMIKEPALPATEREEYVTDASGAMDRECQKLAAECLKENSPEAKARLAERIRQLDDWRLCDCAGIPADVLLRMLSLKYGRDIRGELEYRRGSLWFQNLSVVNVKEIPFVIEEMAIAGKKLVIRGNAVLPLSATEVDYFLMDGKSKRHEIRWSDGDELFFIGEAMHTRKRFEAEIVMEKLPLRLRFMFCYRERHRARIRMAFAKSLGIRPDTRENFAVMQGILIKSENRTLSAERLGRRARLKLFFTFPWKSIKMYVGQNKKK